MFVIFNVMGKAAINNEIVKEISTLRQRGFSIPEIHRLLKISKATVFRYSKNIQRLPEFEKRWLDRRNASKIISERQQNLAKNKASALFVDISDQSLALIGAALYWAEGAKKDFSLTNSDPEMVRVFILILKKVFGIKNEDLKVSLRLYEDIDRGEAIKFWSGVVGLELGNNVSINTLIGKKKGKLKYGMCRIRVRKSGLLLKTIFAINKRVCEIISS